MNRVNRGGAAGGGTGGPRTGHVNCSAGCSRAPMEDLCKPLPVGRYRYGTPRGVEVTVDVGPSNETLDSPLAVTVAVRSGVGFDTVRLRWARGDRVDTTYRLAERDDDTPHARPSRRGPPDRGPGNAEAGQRLGDLRRLLQVGPWAASGTEATACSGSRGGTSNRSSRAASTRVPSATEGRCEEATGDATPRDCRGRGAIAPSGRRAGERVR